MNQSTRPDAVAFIEDALREAGAALVSLARMDPDHVHDVLDPEERRRGESLSLAGFCGTWTPREPGVTAAALAPAVRKAMGGQQRHGVRSSPGVGTIAFCEGNIFLGQFSVLLKRADG